MEGFFFYLYNPSLFFSEATQNPERSVYQCNIHRPAGPFQTHSYASTSECLMTRLSCSVFALFPELWFGSAGRITLSRGHFLPRPPHGNAMHNARIPLWIMCSKKCPLPALVIGNPLTMNNDRHQGAKCPVQDTVGISLLTGGEQHLFGCWMQRWFISLTNTPRLKVTVSCFTNAPRGELNTPSIKHRKHDVWRLMQS